MWIYMARQEQEDRFLLSAAHVAAAADFRPEGQMSRAVRSLKMKHKTPGLSRGVNFISARTVFGVD
jgi:hypothetical protein